MPTSKPEFPSRHLDQFNIRLPEGLRVRLRKLAERNNRSMNAEIISILENAVERRIFEGNPSLKDSPPESRLSYALDMIIDSAIGMQEDIATVVLARQKL